jgi:hypothetical protein
MKFLSGLKKGKAEKTVKLKIPIYHRTGISFFNHSDVYIVHRTYQSNQFIFREVILSSLKPQLWHLIRKLTISAIEQPGIINLITAKLAELNINVNVEEALTTKMGAIHTVSLIIALSIYVHNNSSNFNTDCKVPLEAIQRIEKELRDWKICISILFCSLVPNHFSRKVSTENILSSFNISF